MKKTLLFFLLLSLTTVAMSQIKIFSSGNVGIGTNDANTRGKLKIVYNGADFVFHASNKTDGKSYFGTNNSSDGSTIWINFYHPAVGYNAVRFLRSVVSSDSTLKTGITPITNATNILNQINTYSYYLSSDSSIIGEKDYGVLAQEVIEILPEVVDTCNETMFVNYNAFIGILIAGFREQQAIIETLQTAVFSQENDLADLQQTALDLQKWVYGCCGTPKGGQQSPPHFEEPEFFQEEKRLSNEETNILHGKAILYQNIPNPFTSNTEIVCQLPETAKSATIYIYNLQGIELKAYQMKQSGKNTITVIGSALTAGMYLYTLVVDNEIIDTKRMILTK